MTYQPAMYPTLLILFESYLDLKSLVVNFFTMLFYLRTFFAALKSFFIAFQPFFGVGLHITITRIFLGARSSRLCGRSISFLTSLLIFLIIFCLVKLMTILCWAWKGFPRPSKSIEFLNSQSRVSILSLFNSLTHFFTQQNRLATEYLQHHLYPFSAIITLLHLSLQIYLHCSFNFIWFPIYDNFPQEPEQHQKVIYSYHVLTLH